MIWAKIDEFLMSVKPMKIFWKSFGIQEKTALYLKSGGVIWRFLCIVYNGEVWSVITIKQVQKSFMLVPLDINSIQVSLPDFKLSLVSLQISWWSGACLSFCLPSMGVKSQVGFKNICVKCLLFENKMDQPVQCWYLVVKVAIETLGKDAFVTSVLKFHMLVLRITVCIHKRQKLCDLENTVLASHWDVAMLLKMFKLW